MLHQHAARGLGAAKSAGIEHTPSQLVIPVICWGAAPCGIALLPEGACRQDNISSQATELIRVACATPVHEIELRGLLCTAVLKSCAMCKKPA